MCFRPLVDDVTRINFRFRLLVTWSSLHGRDASSHKIWCIYHYPIQSYWYFSEIKDGGRHHLGFAWVSHGTTRELSFVARTSCKNFVMIASVVFKLYFFSFRLESPIHGPKISIFWRFYRQHLGAHSYDPQKALTWAKRRVWALIDLDLTHSATCGLGKENKKRKKRQWQTGYSPRPSTSPYRSQSLHAGWPQVCVTNGGVKSAQTPPCDILFFFRLPRISRKSSDTDTV